MQLSGRYLRAWVRSRLDAVRVRRGLLAGYRLVIYRSGWVCLEPVEKLRPGPEEIAVRILASAVSPGTERANYLRLRNTAINYPHAPGYSAAGEVVWTGAKVKHLEPGQLVAVRSGHASFAVVPAGAVHSVSASRVASRVLALWYLGVIALQGVHRAGPLEGSRVAVIGQGQIGLLAARLAKARGAQVDMLLRSDPSPAAVASANGVVQGEAAWRDAAGRYEVVLDCSGDPSALIRAATVAARRGRIVLLGSNRGATGPFDWGAILARKEIAVIGAHIMAFETATEIALSDIGREVVGRLADGTVQGDDLAGERLDPHEAWRYYRRLARRSGGAHGAWFDWTTIDRRDACRRRSLLRGPLRLWNEESLGEEIEAAREGVAGRLARR